jgi:ribonuclease T1
MRQKKSFVYQYLVPIILLGGLLLIVKGYQSCQNKALSTPVENTEAKSQNTNQDSQTEVKTVPGVPKKALEVLAYIRTHDKAPPGVVGGRTFQNREKLLRAKDDQGQTIKYREWDVNKKESGKNRGTQRLITGSDQSAYYTKDHYKSFQRIE